MPLIHAPIQYNREQNILVRTIDNPIQNITKPAIPLSEYRIMVIPQIRRITDEIHNVNTTLHDVSHFLIERLQSSYVATKIFSICDYH